MRAAERSSLGSERPTISDHSSAIGTETTADDFFSPKRIAALPASGGAAIRFGGLRRGNVMRTVLCRYFSPQTCKWAGDCDPPPPVHIHQGNCFWIAGAEYKAAGHHLLMLQSVAVLLISPLWIDPCITKFCGPYGVGEDNTIGLSRKVFGNKQY